MKEKPRKRLRYIRFYLAPWREIVKQYGHNSLGVLFEAAVRYADTGEEADWSEYPSLRSTWLLYRSQLDRDMERHGRQTTEQPV
ncbi:MAG: hypothetical protein IJR54_00790 [Oscillibacter sp.]|nr:hypothetical protein [Oscillibacter sp.]